MTSKDILKADLLDILFEQRNKMYGAYALRKNYNQRLATALGLSLSPLIFLILFSLFRVKNLSDQSPGEDDRTVRLSQFILPNEKPIEPEIKEKKPALRPRESQVNFAKIQIVKNNEVLTTIPDISQIEMANIGTENIAGNPPSGLALAVEGNNSTGSKESVNTPPDANEFIPDEMEAGFPGGTAAWLSFLKRYLQTPGDLDAGEKVTVRVRFWIDVDGSVSRFEVIESGGILFDKEVLRVMKKMPRWIPARQNKRYVAVAFTQPVIYIGSEE
jgi:periplasmic protein TonB